MFVIGFNLTSGFCARNKRNRTYAVLVKAQYWRLVQWSERAAVNRKVDSSNLSSPAMDVWYNGYYNRLSIG